MATTDTVQVSTLTAVCKLRWIPKASADPLTIPNVEALRLMATSIMMEENNQSGEAAIKEQKAMQVLEKELKEYLAGVKQTIPTVDAYGMYEIGGVL